MINIISKIFLSLFILFSQVGMGMDLVSIHDTEKGIDEMQKGLEFNLTQKELTPYHDHLLLKFFLAEEKRKIFPTEMLEKIWSFLNDADQLTFKSAVCILSLEFYKTIGQNIHLNYSNIRIEKILPKKNEIYSSYNYSQNKFDILFTGTQIIEKMTKEAHDTEAKALAASFMEGHKEQSRIFLNGYKQGRDELRRPTPIYKNYAYLCEVYDSDYDRITCCTRLGLCCSDGFHGLGACCSAGSDCCVVSCGVCCLGSGLFCWNGGEKCFKHTGDCCKISAIGTAACCACLFCWPCLLCCFNNVVDLFLDL